MAGMRGVPGVPWLDHRQQRAMVMFRVIWPEVARYFRDASMASRAADHLFKVLSEGGYEVLSDAMRADAGLPPRGPDGWTAEELHVLEAWRLTALRLELSAPLQVHAPGPLPGIGGGRC